MDPLSRRARAEAIAKQTADPRKAADEIRRLLHEAAAGLDPFPYFLGSFDVKAVEAEPPPGSGPDRGCVVVCPDGELYEYQVGIMDGGSMGGGMDRTEKLERLDLPPGEYVAYALAALDAVTQAQLRKGPSSRGRDPG